MPSQLAFLACLGFVYWLFREEAKERPIGSKAIWFPAIWLLILSTRPLAYWVGSAENLTGSTRSMEAQDGPGGSPFDLAVLGILIVAGVRILLQRRIDWGAFVRENGSILALYLFFLISMAWADYPFSVFKRVVKDFSIVLFALVILTEANPGYAIRKLILRCSFIVFTFSALTIKYFPDIGRNSTRAGENMFTGLTTQKNTLGEVVFTYSIVLLWDLIELRRAGQKSWRDRAVLIRYLMLALGFWLLVTCDSQTSLLVLCLGVGMLWGTSRLLRMRNPKQKLVMLGIGMIAMFSLDSTFNIKEMVVVDMLGRDLTFTGRTYIWEQVLEMPVNRLVGAGYLMFWDGHYGQSALDEMGVRISTAHNGYLEVLLDGGLIGVALLGIMLLGRGNAIVNRMVAGDNWGRIAFIFWVLALIHNFSESTFFRFSILWFFLMLSMITPPRLPGAAVPAPGGLPLRGRPGRFGAA